jgi:phosphatidylglycerophosphatase A
MALNEKINESESTDKVNFKKYGFGDYCALALSTCGVGYVPIAPGTFGSVVGVLIYLFVVSAEANFGLLLSAKGWRLAQISASLFACNLVLLFSLCLAGIWASKRTAQLLNNKDPQKVVIDEVMGQLVVFLFVPLGVHWGFVLAGFLLFRLFDIWKPYPIRAFEDIPNGIGVCADDLVAGIYGGICLAVIYAVSLN